MNDELGHPVGDTVLVELGRILQGIVRDSDIVARIGGEEFLMILPHSRADRFLYDSKRGGRNRVTGS